MASQQHLLRIIRKEFEIGNPMKLATSLNYKTIETMRMWLKRRSIPVCKLKQVEDFYKRHGIPTLTRENFL